MRSLAFGGAFFAWPFHAGVAAYAQEHALLPADARIYGTSSGAVIATLLACGVDVATTGLELGLRADRLGLGGQKTPFFRPRKFLAPHIDEMDRALPADAHVRATGRLFISLRRWPRFRQESISSFPDRATLFDVLAAAVAVPGLTVPLVHRSPRFGPCLDGGPGVPRDDRPGAVTTSVGIFQRGAYDLEPSTPIARGLVFGVPDDGVRKQLFARGYADAARYFA